MKSYEAARPTNVGVLRTDTVMLQADRGADLLQQLERRYGAEGEGDKRSVRRAGLRPYGSAA